MPRAKTSFRSVDLSNAMKAARAAGLTIIQTEIDREGKITLVHARSNMAESAATPDELLDEWKATRSIGYSI